jgi:hypothetical protein
VFRLTHKTRMANLDARFWWPFKFYYVQNGCHLRQVLMDVKCVGMVTTVAFQLTHKTCVANLDVRFGWPFKFRYVQRVSS